MKLRSRYFNFDEEEDDIDREELFRHLAERFAKADREDILGYGIETLGEVFNSFAGVDKYEDPGFKPRSRKYLMDQMDEERSERVLSAREKYAKSDFDDRERARDLERSRQDIERDRIQMERDRRAAPQGDPKALTDDEIDALIDQQEVSLESMLQKFSAKDLARIFQRQKERQAPKRTMVDPGTDYGPPIQPDPGYDDDPGEEYRLERPMSYDDAQSLPGGPTGLLGEFIGEQMYGFAPSKGKKEKQPKTPKPKAPTAGKTEIWAEDQPLQPGESFTPEQRQEQKDVTPELRTLRAFGAAAMDLTEAIRSTDETGAGLMEGPEYPPLEARALGFTRGDQGDLPGVGGWTNAIGSQMEDTAMKDEKGGLFPVLSQMAGAFIGPLGSTIRNTSDHGIKIRQLAESMKLMGSSLMVKGEGQISDWERKMAAHAIGMDPSHKYADRNIRIGLQRMLEDMADRVADFKDEHPQLWETYKLRDHTIARLDEWLQSAYPPNAVNESTESGNEIEVTAPDGQVYRVRRRWDAENPWSQIFGGGR